MLVRLRETRVNRAGEFLLEPYSSGDAVVLESFGIDTHMVPARSTEEWRAIAKATGLRIVRPV
jgi:hypothetical protein